MNKISRTQFRLQGAIARQYSSFTAVGLLGALTIGNGLPAYAQQEARNAMIVIETVSNTKATRGKKIAVTYYQDEQCSRRGKSEKVFRKNYAKDLHRFNPLMVETDTRFIFQVSYIEKRRGETRACDAISSVSLKPSRSYRAVFRVIDDVVGCNIKVFDITDIIERTSTTLAAGGYPPKDESNSRLQYLEVPIVDAYPESTCAKVGKKGYKSGTPVYSYENRLG